MSQSAHRYAPHEAFGHEAGTPKGSLTSGSAAPPTTVLLPGVPRLRGVARAVLWADAVAAGCAGLVLLAARESLADWFGLSVQLVAGNGIANWAYASYSGTLAALTALGVTPSRRSLGALVLANWVWALVCVVLVLRNWETGTALGFAYLAIEGVFVAALGCVEYRVLVRPRWSRGG